MIKYYKLLTSILLFTFFSCENDSERNLPTLNVLSQVQVKFVTQAFYNSSTNVIEPIKTKVKFSVLPLSSSEAQFV